MKSEVDIDSLGANVSSITESRSGGILIRLAKNSKKSDLADDLKNKLGDRANVREMDKFDVVEIQDLDSVTTAEDIIHSIHKSLGTSPDDAYIQVKSIRQSFMGTQRATVRLKCTHASKLIKGGRIKMVGSMLE